MSCQTAPKVPLALATQNKWRISRDTLCYKGPTNTRSLGAPYLQVSSTSYPMKRSRPLRVFSDSTPTTTPHLCQQPMQFPASALQHVLDIPFELRWNGVLKKRHLRKFETIAEWLFWMWLNFTKRFKFREGLQLHFSNAGETKRIASIMFPR